MNNSLEIVHFLTHFQILKGDNMTEVIINEYLQEKALKGIKESTIAAYSYKLESNILPCLSNNINKNTIFSNMAKLKVHQSNSSYTNTVILMNDFLKYLHDNKHIDCLIKVPYPKQIKLRITVLNIEEQALLKEYLISNLNCFTLGILLARYTGIRIGELSAIKYSDIDNNGVLHITKTLQRIKNIDKNVIEKTIICIDTPKSQCSIRDIPIPKFIMTLYHKLPNINQDGYLLTNSNKFIEPRSIERQYKTLLTKAKIEKHKFHILRHTFATEWVRLGFDIKTLSELLGHSSVKITLDRYVHSDIMRTREYMDKIFT